MEQYNTGQANAMEQFTKEIKIKENSLMLKILIREANAQWRRC